jgi:hypothetical protein
MIHKAFIDQLQTDNTLPPETIERLRSASRKDLFSVFWELKLLLYGGVLLLSTGLGILVYKNIDTIGHQAVLAFIALITISGYAYCYKRNAPFSWEKTNSPNILFDYILLLSALCLLTFVGYLQYQYNVFGQRYGLATFIPMVLLFITAYFFDHLGILSLAITNLAAWAGIVVTPRQLLNAGQWYDNKLIFTGVALGLFLLATAFISKKKEIKPHFEFIYKNFGTHMLYISLLSGMFEFEKYYALWALPMAGLTYYSFKDSIRNHSFYFLLVLTLYAYAGGSYVVTHSLSKIPGIEMFLLYLTPIYSIVSALALVRFLMKMNKKLKKHDRA